MTTIGRPSRPVLKSTPATYCATRRARIAEEFSGRTIVVATGNFKVRQRHGLPIPAGTTSSTSPAAMNPTRCWSLDGERRTAFHALHRGPRDQSTTISSRCALRRTVGRRAPRRHEAARYYEINTVRSSRSKRTRRVGRDRDRQRSRIRPVGRRLPRAEQGRRTSGHDAQRASAVKTISRSPNSNWPSITPSRDSKTSYERCRPRGTRRARDRRRLSPARRVSKATTWATTHCRSGSNATVLHWMRNTGA